MTRRGSPAAGPAAAVVRGSEREDVGVRGNEEQADASDEHETGHENNPHTKHLRNQYAAQQIDKEEEQGKTDTPKGAPIDEADKEVREFTYAHWAAFSLYMTGVTLAMFVVGLAAGAPVEMAHVAVAVPGAIVCFVGGYVPTRKAGARIPARPTHPPFLELRMAIAFIVLAAAVWKVPALLEAAPAILSVLCCLGGAIDGMFVGAIAGRRGLSLAGALSAVWREGIDHRGLWW